MCCTTHVPKDLKIMSHFENIDYTDLNVKFTFCNVVITDYPMRRLFRSLFNVIRNRNTKKFFIPHIVFLYDILTYYSLIIHVYDFISP